MSNNNYIDCSDNYTERKEQVKMVRDTIKGLEHVKCQTECYLPMTAGMKGRDRAGLLSKENASVKLGTAQYIEYMSRTFMPDTVCEVKSGIIGLAFAQDVESNIDYPITKDGRNGERLAIDVLGQVQESGTHLLVVDAPAGEGSPYITEYPFESFVDYAVDENNKALFSAVKLKEDYFKPDDTYKTTPIVRYREYNLIDNKPVLFIRDENGNDLKPPKELKIDRIPVIVAGSVDNLPGYDPVPLLPVTRAMLQIYRDSADYGQFKALYGQGTPYAAGLENQEEADNIMMMGFGAGSLWYSMGENASFGMIEVGERSDEIYMRAFELQMKYAERHAVAITQDTAGVEAAQSMHLRAATKHASIYTMLNSISSAIVSATNLMLKWSGKPENAEFQLSTEFNAQEISSQLITALDRSVTSGNTAISVLNNAVRKAKLTEKSDEELAGEIMDREA
tara:strand:+ start:2837 stop:4189 length:1353 start_codon:yes stop_codon:yes gene_type:complete